MIQSKKQFSLGILFVIFGFLIGTNPMEKHFLDRLASDYSGIHAGMKINTTDLLEGGKSLKCNYLLFSTFNYQFGSIGVSYFGIAGTIFFTGSYRAEVRENKSRSV